MHDLKTGYLLHANPYARFIGMLIGSTVGAIISTFAYLVYSANYEVPSGLFEVPTAFIWLYAARLFNGGNSPEKVPQFSLGIGAAFILISILRICVHSEQIQQFIPSGVAFPMGRI